MTTINEPLAPTTVDAAEPPNGFAIAALSLGILGLLFGLMPMAGFLSFGLGAVGAIFALSNRGRLSRGRSAAEAMTWAGLATSVLAVAVGIWGIVAVFTAVQQLDRDLDQVEISLDHYRQCVDHAQTHTQIARCD